MSPATKPLLIALALLSGLLAAAAPAADIEPAPATYVDDRAGIIDATTERQLIGFLQELEQKTAARIIVLTVETTGGQDMSEFAFERADAWKFGPKRTSASALVVIAAKDRKYKIEVGYDWEAVLTDGYVGQAARTYLVPHFKAGRSSRGVLEVTAALAQKVAEDRGVALTGMPKLTRRPGPACALGGFLPMGLLILAASLGRGRRRGMLFWGILAGSMMGGRGGGGFGGGGFGSFGGGGGGGFGGGGAGGSW